MSKDIEKRAIEILNECFPNYKDIPASISGKYHIGETHEQHLQLVNNILKHMCDEFNIHDIKRDILLASGWLHDIGEYEIIVKGKVDGDQWTYYEKSDYSRLNNLMKSHGSIGAKILDNYDIPFKEDIKRLVACHMSHWYKNEPQPQQLDEYLICVADYVASRGTGIFEYKGYNK